MKKTTTEYIDDDTLKNNLKENTIKGGLYTLTAQLINLLVTLGSTAILARLLTPRDFGLVAMVTAITGLVAMFKDAGLSMATIQKDSISQNQISNLFWLNILVSLLLFITIAALSPIIASVYKEPKLTYISLIISSFFLFEGLAIQHQAILKRQMKFGTIAKIQIYSVTIAAIAAITTAIYNAGYWSIIIQIGVSQLTATLLTWSLSNWRPSRPAKGRNTGEMVKFGGYLTGFNLANYFGRNVDNFLIGRAWGGDSLGLYSKAYSLLLAPIQQINSPISSVAIPALSRLQNSPKEFRSFFIKLLNIMSFITFPIVAFIIVCRTEIIYIFLGEKWVQSIPIFTILAFSAFLQPIGNISGVLYIALNRTKRMMKWGVISSATLVIAFFIGLSYGPVGVAYAYSITIWLLIYPLIYFATQGTCISTKDFYRGVSPSIGTTILITVLGFNLHQYAQHFIESKLYTLLIVGISMATTYIISTYYINPVALKDLYNLIKRKK